MKKPSRSNDRKPKNLQPVAAPALPHVQGGLAGQLAPPDPLDVLWMGGRQHNETLVRDRTRSSR